MSSDFQAVVLHSSAPSRVNGYNRMGNVESRISTDVNATASSEKDKGSTGAATSFTKSYVCGRYDFLGSRCGSLTISSFKSGVIIYVRLMWTSANHRP